MQESFFAPHGNIQTSIDENMVIINVEGHCNTEFFQQMAKELAVVREQVEIEQYTALIILHGEALATQDAMLFLTQYLEASLVNAVAFNLSDVLTPALTQNICHQSFAQVNIRHDFFQDNESAKAWLKQCIKEGSSGDTLNNEQVMV
ncbi:hypothetical protein [Thalassotalea sp. G2M2-11]|uniref:hypothetical protein n=1 Tax=Thalassotalea sp. G2M2-11 TaxID=2787627 RepID=UPI0019D2565C|nr:hypothetical protein [Thalassotalea sp. G2M2-11]